MELFQPMIALDTYAWLRTLTPDSSVVRSRRTPSSTTQPGPMTAGHGARGEMLAVVALTRPQRAHAAYPAFRIIHNHPRTRAPLPAHAHTHRRWAQ